MYIYILHQLLLNTILRYYDNYQVQLNCTVVNALATKQGVVVSSNPAQGIVIISTDCFNSSSSASFIIVPFNSRYRLLITTLFRHYDNQQVLKTYLVQLNCEVVLAGNKSSHAF